MEAIVAPLLLSAGVAAPTVGTVVTAGQVLGGIASAASGLFSIMGAISSVGSGAAAIAAGQQQQAMYNLQATQAQMQGRQAQIRAKSDELKYRQQGVAALDRTLSTVATIAARAGAGSIDPFSGSAGALGTYAFGKGLGEFNFAQESAALARETGNIGEAAGNIQAALYTISGEQALAAGYVRGAANIVSGLQQFSQIGGSFGSSGPSDISSYPRADVPLPPVRPAGL
jgi:hypothetical protein